jgi:hypothetical protein
MAFFQRTAIQCSAQAFWIHPDVVMEASAVPAGAKTFIAKPIHVNRPMPLVENIACHKAGPDGTEQNRQIIVCSSLGWRLSAILRYCSYGFQAAVSSPPFSRHTDQSFPISKPLSLIEISGDAVVAEVFSRFPEH